MPLSKAMPVVAPGVAEIRIKGEDRQFRTFYLAADSRGILVLHAFIKKTQTTPPVEIHTARRRLKELQDE